MPQDTPSRKLDQYIVRFPDGMRDKLKAAAADNNRSMNAEIVARLEESFQIIDGYKDLGDLLLETLQDNLDQGRRELEETTQLFSTLQMSRYLISRLVEIAGEKNIPKDLAAFINLFPTPTQKQDDDPIKFLTEYAMSVRRQEDLEKELRDSVPPRSEKIERLTSRLKKMTKLDHK